MMPESFKYYLCPKCGYADLRCRDESQLSKLICCGCDANYPIERQIPRFVSTETYAKTFGFQWNLNRKAQLDSHTGLSVSRDRLFEVTNWPEDMRGQFILEAGSGAGRFTEVLLKTGAEVFSFDMSAAVEANWINNGQNANLHLFQGDINKMPLRKMAFDKVFCLGVLQHTPDPEKAFKNLSTYVRPDGELVIDIYKNNMISLLQWKYLLRPITKRIDPERLYAIVSSVVPALMPASVFLQRIAGKLGSRLFPIVAYSNPKMSKELNKEWSILDTFDMYSPAHDHPQSLTTVKRWFRESGFKDIDVHYGPNGIVGKGRRPE